MGVRWGYIDRTGAWVVEPQGAAPGEPEATSGSRPWAPEGGPWDEIAGIAENVALVRTGADWRFVDRAGKLVGRGVFTAAGLPGEGLAPVERDGEWGFYDVKAGRQAIQPQFQAALPFKDGRAGVRINGSWGYVDRTGAPTGEAEWEAVGGYSERLGAVRRGGLWGFVDTKGEVVIPPRFDVVGAFRGGRAPAGVAERAPVAFGPTRGVRLRPRLGLQDPLFEGMGPEDRLQVWLGFAPLAGEAGAALQSVIEAWGEGVGQGLADRPFVGEAAVWLEVGGLPMLRQDVSTLVEAVLEAGLPLREAAFTRLRDGAWTDGSASRWPDVRIGEGLEPSTPEREDARTKQVCKALQQVLSDWFADAWHPPDWPAVRPQVLSPRGEPGEIDRISAEGRAGYAFAVDPEDVEQILTPERMRWREAELLEAIVAVARGLGLERAIAWERTPTAFVFQLWEAPAKVD